MRSEQEIRNRFEKLYRRRLHERIQKYSDVCPVNCVHNRRHRIKDHGQVGFCSCSDLLTASRRRVIVCDEVEVAKKCQHFEQSKTEDEIVADFEEVLKDPSRCGHEYPKLAALIWVLQEPFSEERGQQRVKHLVDTLVRTLKGEE